MACANRTHTICKYTGSNSEYTLSISVYHKKHTSTYTNNIHILWEGNGPWWYPISVHKPPGTKTHHSSTHTYNKKREKTPGSTNRDLTEWDLAEWNLAEWDTGRRNSWCRRWKVFLIRLWMNVWRVNGNDTECIWGECSRRRNCLYPLGEGVNTVRAF